MASFYFKLQITKFRFRLNKLGRGILFLFQKATISDKSIRVRKTKDLRL